MRSFVGSAFAAILLVTACGDDGGVRHLDGGVDAPDIDGTPDAMPDPVTITVTIDGVPQSGIQIYFQAADSTVVAMPLTDANGKATAQLDHGGFVTAIEPFSMPNGVIEKLVRSFSGVKPGDQLVLDGPLTTSVQMTIDVQASSDAALNYYEIHSTCGSAFTDPSTLSVMMYFNGCGAKTNVLLEARNAQTRILQYIYAPDVDVTANGTLDLTNATTYPYALPTSRTYTYNNVPAAFTPVRIADTVVSARGPLGQVVVNATGTPRMATQPVPMFTGATSVIEANSEDGFVRQTLVDWGPYTTSFSTDWSTRALAPLTVAPTWDQPNHKIVWSEGSGIQPDLTYSRVQAFRSTSLLAWEIVAAHAAGTLTLPLLPSGGAYNYNFDAADTVSVEDVRVIKVPGGYDAVRAHAFADGALIPLVGATGSAAAEEFSIQ